MSERTIIHLSSRRQALRRRWRQLKKLGVILAVPAADQDSYGLVIPFRQRAEPLLGRFSQFEPLAAAARGEDAESEQPSRPECCWQDSDAAPAESRGAQRRLSMRWTRPAVPAEDSTFIRPVLTVIPGGLAGRDLGA